MALAIRAIRTATPEEWDAAWGSCPSATYFHSRAWAEAWARYQPGRLVPAPRWVTFTDGRRVLLPLSRERVARGLDWTTLASPAGTYGGWLAAEPLGGEHVALLTEHLIRRCGTLLWRVNPYAEQPAPIDPRLIEADETHVLDLRAGFDPLAARWARGAIGRKVRRAREAGLCVQQAAGPEEWRAYYEIYRDSVRRWGEQAPVPYGWRLFESWAAGADPAVALWLVIRAGAPIAGALVLSAPRHAVYWHGAALAEHFALRPVNLLMQAIVEETCRQGRDWFDFNPSGGHAGVTAFKRSFGAHPRPCPLVRRVTVRGRVAGRVARLRARWRVRQ